MDTKEYTDMTKEELICVCLSKDYSMQQNKRGILNKEDIMKMYKCENNKALRILKLMFQTGFGIKIGKEYYISEEAHEKFLSLYCELPEKVPPKRKCVNKNLEKSRFSAGFACRRPGFMV